MDLSEEQSLPRRTNNNSENLKIWFSEEGHLLARCRIKRENFYPRQGLETGPLALHANAFTNGAIQDKYGSTIELIY